MTNLEIETLYAQKSAAKTLSETLPKILEQLEALNAHYGEIEKRILSIEQATEAADRSWEQAAGVDAVEIEK